MKRINYLLVLSIFIMTSCQQKEEFQNNIIQQEIADNWKFKGTGKKSWMQATVPGTVHTDLLNNGMIDDPFYRTNERDLQWIDKADWEYRSKFIIEKDIFEKNEIKLVFEGLDTYATVYLNENEILQTDNMFRSWEVSCKEFLHLGENELRVVLYSPINIGLEKLEANGYSLPASNDQSENGELGDKKVSIFTRKAGYHFGWDWGPRLVTSGIWRPVQLLAYDYGKVENVHIIQNKLTDGLASMEAVLEINSMMDDEFNVSIYVDGEEHAGKKMAVSKGTNQLSLPFEIKDPKFWWPNGMGDQHLYDVEVRVEKTGVALVDKMHFKIGLRTAKLVQEPDADGKSFYFEINGQPVFAKGANYIPNDVFLPRFQPADYERIIKDAAEANMNMLRVWGGGIYENDIFYDLCDQYGIMVWQDFMYACSMYPGDDDFLNNARLEAEENIKRLRNHPSLVLWCGNNEIEAAWGEYEAGRGWNWKERYIEEQRQQIWHDYDTLFHHILPEAVKQFNPQTDYWHSSPSGGMGKLASHTNTSGDMHYWGVWHGQEPFSDFRKYRARFMSEYGFQSFPELNTVKTYALPDEWNIESEVMAAHQRSGIGNLRIRQYMEEDYIIPEGFEEFLYVSQLLQAEGIKTAIEAHRAEKPYCMGTLYWQLNDCWPVASWSGIDYYGRWKAMQYFVKKAYEETIIATFQNNEGVEVWLSSDKTAHEQCSVEMQIIDFSGNQLWQNEFKTETNPDSAKMIFRIPLKEIQKLGDPGKMVMVTSLLKNGNIKYRDFHYFIKPKYLKLEEPELDISISEADDHFAITLSAKKLTKNVFLSTDISKDHFSDNYFDLLPGEPTTIYYPKVSDLKTFKESLGIKHLFETL